MVKKEKEMYDNEDQKDIILVKNRKDKTWYVTRMHFNAFIGRDRLQIEKEEKTKDK